ncbi:hypothetical protein Glove_78g25 [Diversispora epigaea]|uniref:C3H1-type domain-containing protein n=1 Tax=Diversispora epigaea TaxID=1348612 RepID=A0A397J9N2_9GLOM|nr:hypothetical protein Glove_78g25 [Diversispora epigaea]
MSFQQKKLIPGSYSLPPPPPIPSNSFLQNNTSYEQPFGRGRGLGRGSSRGRFPFNNRHSVYSNNETSLNNITAIENSTTNTTTNAIDQGVQFSNCPPPNNYKFLSKPYCNDESTLKPVVDFKLDTPEALMKWIEERKKRYPTDVNIAKKKQAEADRIARGEVIKNEYKKRKQYDRVQDDYKTKKFKHFNGQLRVNESNKINKVVISGLTDLEIAAASAGAGAGADDDDSSVVAKMDNATSNADVENVQNSNFNTKIYKNDYRPIPRIKRIAEKFYDKVCIKYLPGHCPSGKDCGNRHEGTMICPPLLRPPDWQRVRTKNLRDMLLYKERAQEKNIILQCLRYIINNNFFGIVTNKALKNAKKRGDANIIEINSTEEIRETKQEEFNN